MKDPRNLKLFYIQYEDENGEDVGERYTGSYHRSIRFDNGKTLGVRPDTFNYLLPHSAALEPKE